MCKHQQVCDTHVLTLLNEPGRSRNGRTREQKSACQNRSGPVKKETALTCSFCVHVQSYREQHLEAMVADACTGADTCWHPATSFGLEMCYSHLLKSLEALLPTNAGQLTLLQDTVFFASRAELIRMPPKHHISSEGSNRESLICFSLID